MNLFQLGKFTLHSGEKTDWKIDCDALTNDDIEAIALMMSEIVLTPFKKVFGVPSGGIRLAKALEKHSWEDSPKYLIVDDVLTTGNSMNEYKEKISLEHKIPQHCFDGAVIFSRISASGMPNWVESLFRIYY